MWISTAATKPFLRQIETLRSAHSAQTANWEKVEADMTHRLGIFMINFYHVFVVKCEAKKIFFVILGCEKVKIYL